MTSSALLSVELLSLLLPFTEPFATTSARFRSRLASDDEDTFPRVCELHNTLDLLAESKKPISHLWDLRGSAAAVTEVGGDRSDSDDVGNNVNKDAEDLLSFMLNSEFVLYELYHEYEVSLNPSLAHWVGICREFDKYTREHAESNAEWGLRERVLKIRAAFVKGILGDQGPNVCIIYGPPMACRELMEALFTIRYSWQRLRLKTLRSAVSTLTSTSIPSVMLSAVRESTTSMM
jgi:hypothetical protein